MTHEIRVIKLNRHKVCTHYLVHPLYVLPNIRVALSIVFDFKLRLERYVTKVKIMVLWSKGIIFRKSLVLRSIGRYY
ncbi:hypothetical protein LINGRAHAP2_LOCUS31683 [Linum grandiflorum]